MDPKRLFRAVDNEGPRMFRNERSFRFETSGTNRAGVVSTRAIALRVSLGASVT